MILALALSLLQAQDPCPRVPEGFSIEKAAGPPLVERPIMAGLDDKGRLFVADSSGVNLKINDLFKDPPHRIVRLEDTDGDGVFDKSVVFAEKLTFPMGALWHEGALYVCAPPSVWRFPDADGDGVADSRQELVTKFGASGNAADIHGPFLGPDGRIYWADGRHGHNIKRADGSVLAGKAARIFRAKPDGSEVEVVCGGGMDNPVEVAFTEEGEPLATVALFLAQPRRVDAIIHCIEGGVFPYHEVVKEFKRTGELLPSVVDVGWTAPSGLMRYRGDAFGKEYADNFFSAHFNTHKVQRHVIERDGATFRGRNEDFLVSEDPDFHPTDVLEDADGSLLVLNTGGWFRIGCPTSRIDKPQIKGAIYRIRKKDAPRPRHPRGEEIDFHTRSPAALIRFLDDPRFAVRDRMMARIARELGAELRPFETALEESPSARLRRNILWTLSRSTVPETRPLLRKGLYDKDAGVRLVAARCLGLLRDAESWPRLADLLRDDAPPVRREAATALGRIREKAAAAPLLDGLRAGGDRFLEHSLIFALIEIGNLEGTRKGLQDESATVRRGALIALDQIEGGNLAREEVTACLDPSNPALLQAALSIITARPEWAHDLTLLLREWLAGAPREDLRGALVAFAKDVSTQDLVAQALRDTKTPAPMRVFLLETMAQAPLDRLPPTWTAELRWSLDHADAAVVRQAVATLRATGVTEFEEPLLRIAKDDSRPEDLRTEAAAAARPARVEPGIFSFLMACLGPEKPVLLRFTAAQALGAAGLSNAQLGTMAQAIGGAGAMELPKLLAAYERSGDANAGKRLVAALGASAALESLTAESLRRALKSYPEDVRKSAEPLLKKLEIDVEKQKARLEELAPLLTGGDAARGREVYFGKKAACSACHAVQSQGGRVGPDLTRIASIRAGADLLESIAFPSASFARGYEPTLIRTKDGAVLDGLIARETADAIFLALPDHSEKRVPRASIDALQQSRTSIMPQGLDAQLSRDEFRDLLAFLGSLK